MAGFGLGGGKLKKRKEIELDDAVYDDFSAFSLSSPANKIRRLHAELPPIIEEEGSEIPIMAFEHGTAAADHQNYGDNFGRVGGGPVIEELLPLPPPPAPQNEERAIVLFKPVNTPLLHSPSNFRVSLDSNLISGLKNQVLWSGQASGWRAEDDDAAAAKKDKNNGVTSNSLAVVPWMPSRSLAPVFEISQAGVAPELMEAEEETEAATMEVEDNNDVMVGGTSVAEGLRHWQQQQHCMLPQPPDNTSTPIVSYRWPT